MAGEYRFAMDQKDIVRLLVATIDDFTRGRLMNKEHRNLHKEQCAERLAAEDGSHDKDTEVRYSDQAVLANLDWGIEALEEALNTSNIETKFARLDHAEKMLQVCALLNSNEKTAGVPNFYLSAWAHLNLSYLWKLRGNVHNSALHILEMFIVDPFFSRIDFAPELWKELFLPHMSSIVGWYSEERHRLVIEVIPDSSDLSFTADIDQFFNESLIFSLRPDQVEKLQKLEKLYGESLDENSRLFAKYFKDCMNSDSSSTKKVAPMLPIAEPPMTPLHEVSRSIPDYIKFGPILPKSAGFSSILLRSKDGATEASRPKGTSSPANSSEKFAGRYAQNDSLEEIENDSDHEPFDSYELSDTVTHKLLSPSSTRTSEDEQIGPKGETSKMGSCKHSPTIFSPISSPSIPSPKVLSPTANEKCKNESRSALRLLSSRFGGQRVATSVPRSPATGSDHSFSPVESEGEKDRHRRRYRQTHNAIYNDVSNQDFENCLIDKLEEESRSRSSEIVTHIVRPPKDFVCPITGQIFSEPVTLETGQTYERKAIQEWLKRGNTTCPITRQPLSSTVMPKMNYVLKRLITSWQEQHPDLAQDCSWTGTSVVSTVSSSFKMANSLASTPCRPFHIPLNSTYESLNQKGKRLMQEAVSSSPTSVISQATVEKIINSLKPFVSCLCNFESLKQCETAVLAIAGFWKDSKGDLAVHSYLSELAVVNGFVEVLLNSREREVLRTSIYVLSELICADGNVGESLSSLDSDFDCLASLLTSGLSEASVLMCLLRPTFTQLSAHDLIPSLAQMIQKKNEEFDHLPFVIEPKNAAIAMLEQIFMGGDETSQSRNAERFTSAEGIPALVKFLGRVEVRRPILSILLCCMRVDQSCKDSIVEEIELAPVLEFLHTGNDDDRGLCVAFLSELVQMHRRTKCNQILQTIKDEGAFSTMHTLLTYLQMAPIEQQPGIASLLLQLDLLTEPRRMSIYREESIEALFEAFRRKDNYNSQIAAVDASLYLSGRFTSSGKSYTKAWLLKLAGFDQPYNALMKAEGLRKPDYELSEREEEEKAVSVWEKRIALVLCNHEKGYIFEVMKECLKSKSLEMAKSCLVIVSWLCHMVSTLPDTGVQETARRSLLDELVNVLQSSNSLEEKILACLVLKTFISDPAALEELGLHATSINKTLRKLRRSSLVVNDIMKALMNVPSVDATELWSYTEVGALDSSSNGEVLSLVHLNGRVLSSHSDGTIKVWDAGDKVLKLIQEARKHTKAVTCLCVSSSGDALYSGSLDKTIRVWTVKCEKIQCVQVHEVKEPIYDMKANANVACFVSQGTGVKVYNFSGVPKHINFNKYVKSLALSEDKLYCGCSGDCILEVDLTKHTTSTFYAGVRKLLWKQNIYSLHLHGDLLFAAGSAVDGTAGKTFSLSNKITVGSFSPGVDIHHMAVSTDLLFTASRLGMIIEVLSKEKYTKIGSLKLGSASGSHAKITYLTTDDDGGLLFVGTSGGKIQVWGLTE
ncbi:putative E3 ubiquitin-protein ligase LIN-1 isoform X1 [Cucurbita moschata]|uniref:RING-type E3 ubiquitin transferase n=1 Tax=Cucurbita moschata TaxID=3662 RepID=A0A6J1F9D5_CUCMO|nr:putative E3 ubiquitin-protein ligase LIN-1 isoform X1 [Cucurbita moschata]XP_022937097.1 putative E3 ubiquitin-protein ligase LIN-1 isoform X1 [Cucurbita moschata]